ncbi:MAG: helix-turn-helix domain-containing protein [Defluviitaleaceae bacterium]|nr:helix-turn-helix domain-containing protein [Defluviitaleaceae bacterium]
MKEINFAVVLISKRREKGITQDELATHIGVSKQSVSKWENGISYPDILLLPQLASYFNISLDELMGYEPQMTKDDIKKLCAELTNDFVVKPFDDVMYRCREIVKNYFSCFPLLYQIGFLILEHGSELNDEAKKTSAIEGAKEIFIRVKTLCDDIELKQLALLSEAVCEMELDNPKAVITILENIKSRFYFHPSVEVMLSQSYRMLGKTHAAKITLQGAIFESVANICFNVPHYLAINTDDKEYFEEICKRTMQMIEIFNAKEVYPIAVMPFYLEAAKGYLTIGSTDKALDMLEIYTEIATNDSFSDAPQKDGFFTFVNEHCNEKRSGVDFGLFEMELSKQFIQQSIINSVVEEPIYATLADEPRYKALTKKLEKQREVL